LATTLYSLWTIFGIGFIIFVHELGHYLAARAVGIRVEAFAIGFGPRLFGWTRGTCDYKLCLIPLGGYVKMAGEDPTRPTTGKPDEFGSKKVWQRVLVISAGVIMNLVFALVAVPIAFSIGVPFEEPVVGSVTAGGPAWEAGVREGDRILEVDGRRVLTFLDVPQDVAVSDGPVTLRLQRDGKELEVRATPHDPTDLGIPRIGLGMAIKELSIAPEWFDSADKSEDQRRVVEALRNVGLTPESRLLAVNGVPVSNGVWFPRELQQAESGGQPLVLSVRSGDGGEVSQKVLPPVMAPGDKRLLGVVSGGPQIRLIRAESATASSGLKAGDIITAVDGRAVTTIEAFPSLVGQGSNVFAKGPDEPAPADSEVTLSVTRTQEGAEANPLQALEVKLKLPTWNSRQAFVYDLAWAGPDSPTVWVRPGQAAHDAGMRSGDVITKVGDKEYKGFATISDQVSGSSGPLSIEVRRPTGPVTLQVTPEVQSTNLLVTTPGMLVPEHPTWKVTVPVGESLGVGVLYTGRMITRVVQTLRSLFRGSVSPKHLGGIITIFRGSQDRTRIGLMRGLLFLAMVSINLAILNILPIPVLDGGWLVFLIIEKIKGSPVSQNTMAYFQWAGLILVLGLMVYVTWNDIDRLIQGM